MAKVSYIKIKGMTRKESELYIKKKKLFDKANPNLVMTPSGRRFRKKHKSNIHREGEK